MSGILYGSTKDKSGGYEIDKDAYIQFVDSMFGGNPPYFDDVEKKSSDELIQFIKDQAQPSGGTALIRDQQGGEEPISSDNAKLKVALDKYKKDNGKNKLNITIAMPGQNPDSEHPQGLGYLDRYVKALVDEAMGGDNQIANPKPAAKLLLGMMLLTRCM